MLFCGTESPLIRDSRLPRIPLGLMYRTGKGVEQNKEQAVAWYRKAAKQGNAKAMFNLGTAYFNGDGVGIDDITAYAWFTLAHENGSAPARDAVSRMDNTLAQWQTSAALEKIGDFYEPGTIFLPTISSQSFGIARQPNTVKLRSV